MYPILFTIPGIDYPISSFGVMMALGFLTAYWLTVRELPSKGINPEVGSTLLMWIMIGGVLGSKLYFAVDMHFRTGDPFTSFLFRRDGITWYGGLIGGTLAGMICCRLNGISIRRVMEAAAPSCAVGQSLGRIGCFLVGDDYGKASDLPRALAFPEGAPPVEYPVHPTQLYGTLAAFVIWSLGARRTRRGTPAGLTTLTVIPGAPLQATPVRRARRGPRARMARTATRASSARAA